MKKTMKKLVLAKETVRSLEENVIKNAAGGSAVTCYYSCGSHCFDTIHTELSAKGLSRNNLGALNSHPAQGAGRT